MRFLIFCSLILAISGCGEDKPKPEVNPVDNASELKALRADTWVAFSTEANLLVEDYNVLGASDASNPDFCFKIGHLVGKAAVLGATVEQLIRHLALTDEQYRKIAVPAEMVQRERIRPAHCDVSYRSIGKDLMALSQGLQDGIQFR